MNNTRRLIDELDRLSDLDHGWDSYGAAPIPIEVINKAKGVAAWLPATYRWSAVPGSDGSIQIESHHGGFSIEIDISKEDSSHG